MRLSCGIVIQNSKGEVFLAHVTGQPQWDLPKGKMEEGETPLQAAVRETFEETGIVVNPKDLSEIGEFPYVKGKRLHLFQYLVCSGAINIHKCRCNSTYTSKHGVELLEMDDFNFFSKTRALELVSKNMRKVLEPLFKE